MPCAKALAGACALGQAAYLLRASGWLSYRMPVIGREPQVEVPTRHVEPPQEFDVVEDLAVVIRVVALVRHQRQRGGVGRDAHRGRGRPVVAGDRSQGRGGGAARGATRGARAREGSSPERGEGPGAG